MKCFYHSADLDGKCSGAIVKMRHPECELIGINYGQAFPWESIVPGETVFMVDFSLQPFGQMEWLSGICDLIWIDHHKSALEQAAASSCFMPFAQHCAIGRAGCELTWEFVYPDKPLPEAVRLLGRYDVWDHVDADVLPFQYGLRLYDLDPNNQELWQAVFYAGTADVIKQGKVLMAYEEQQNAIYVRSYGFEVELDGLRCIALNKGLTGSLVFKSVYDPAKHDAMLTFVRKRDHWKVSLYADKPEVDVSAICAAWGGGGHKGAAGFSVRCCRLGGFRF